MLAASEGRRRIVTALNGPARAAGLKAGMALSHARALVPDVIVEEADPAGDEAALVRLALWAGRHYSPVVGTALPAGLIIEATGVAHLFSGEAALLDDMAGRLARNGFSAVAAMAGTVGAAHARAWFGAGGAVRLVAPGGEAAAVAPLPLAALRLDAETVAALARLGFRTIGDLAATPRAPLVRRFGPLVGRRLDQALGLAGEPVCPVTAAAAVSVSRRLAEPIATAAQIAALTALLVQALCGRLAVAGLGARQLDLLFERVDGAVEAVRIGTAQPTRDGAHLLRLLGERLGTLEPGFGFSAGRLVAVRADRFAGEQKAAAFGGEETGGEETGSDLAALIDRLENRLGPGRLYRLAPVESDVPERAQRRAAPLGAFPAMPKPVGRGGMQLRPPRLLAPPEPIETLAVLPDHPPARFVWRGTVHRIARADGPERIFGEWWKRAAESEAVRDYFQLEDESGARFWVFRAGNGEDAATGSQRWFLHGLFA